MTDEQREAIRARLAARNAAIEILRDDKRIDEWAGVARHPFKFSDCAPTDISTLLAEADRQAKEIERVRGELRHMDAVLARRPALAEIPNRVDKILRALSVAGKAEP